MAAWLSFSTTNQESIMWELFVVLCLVFVVAIAAEIFVRVWRRIFPVKVEQPPVNLEVEEWATVHRVTSQPRQRPDGSWERAAIKWESCDAPVAPNTLDVHDRTAPGHDHKTCRHCQPLKGYSGVSYRSS
jgi:hypothetical protein